MTCRAPHPCGAASLRQPAIPERLIGNPPPTLIGVDNINTFMAGAGFEWDAHLAREAGQSNNQGAPPAAAAQGTRVGRPLKGALSAQGGFRCQVVRFVWDGYERRAVLT